MSQVTRETNHLHAQRSSLASPRNRLLEPRSRDRVRTASVAAGARTCVECGRVDGPKGHDCLAHPRHPGMRTVAAAFFFGPLVLVPVLGWEALLGFLPWFLLVWWVKTR